MTETFPRIAYDEAIAKYGTDKPDLRNPIVMQDVSEHFRGSGFKVFAGMLEKDPKARIWAIPAPTGGSRAFCDRMNGWAQGQGQPGLGYIFFREGEAAGPIAKNLGEERSKALQAQLGLKEGDAVFFVGGDPAKFYKFAGEARTKIGTELNLVDKDRFEFCWIVDFPFYEWDEEEKKIEFSHNPFSMPQGELAALEAAKRIVIYRDKSTTKNHNEALSRSRPINTTWFATASRSAPAPSATTSPRSCTRPSALRATARRWWTTASAA